MPPHLMRLSFAGAHMRRIVPPKGPVTGTTLTLLAFGHPLQVVVLAMTT